MKKKKLLKGHLQLSKEQVVNLLQENQGEVKGGYTPPKDSAIGAGASRCCTYQPGGGCITPPTTVSVGNNCY